MHSSSIRSKSHAPGAGRPRTEEAEEARHGVASDWGWREWSCCVILLSVSSLDCAGWVYFSSGRGWALSEWVDDAGVGGGSACDWGRIDDRSRDTAFQSAGAATLLGCWIGSQASLGWIEAWHLWPPRSMRSPDWRPGGGGSIMPASKEASGRQPVLRLRSRAGVWIFGSIDVAWRWLAACQIHPITPPLAGRAHRLGPQLFF